MTEQEILTLEISCGNMCYCIYSLKKRFNFP